MIAKTKIDVHVGTFSMEFSDNLVQFNIFEAMKHPTEDPSLFGIDVIDELVAEYMQLDTESAGFSNFVEDIDAIGCLGYVIDEFNYDELLEVQDLSDSEDDTADLANLDHNSEFVDLIDQVCKHDKELECLERARVQVVETDKPLPAQTDSTHQVSNPYRVGQPKPSPANDISPLHSPPAELKPLSGYLKYAYLDNDHQFPIIISNNLHREQEEKFLQVLRKHKKEIGWRLSDLPKINPSIYMHKILMEEEAHPIRKQQRRLNLTILKVVKKEVTKLLVVGIIYPISDSR
ncbi:hypothetical protein CR513_11280, partial [Mucuna pruriens]